MRSVKSSVNIRRGDIFFIELGNSEQKRITRPVLVIQNDIGNRYCQSIIVVPLMQLLKAKRLLFSVLINANHTTGLTKDHVALFSQIRTIPKNYFSNDNYLGHIDTHTLEKVDQAIELSLGLCTLQRLLYKNQIKREERKSLKA